MKDTYVFLDLDNTIFDFTLAQKLALEKALNEAGLPVSDDVVRLYDAINISCWERMERGEITKEQVLVERFDILFDRLGVSADSDQIQQRYESFLSIGHYFIPWAQELLEQLYIKHNLFLASNGVTQVQKSRLASSGIERYFQNIFISGDIGYEKPSRNFFAEAFKKIPGFDLKRAIMIGDSLTSDILGGINAGMLTCWYNPKEKQAKKEIKPDYSVRELAEIPPLLDQIFSL